MSDVGERAAPPVNGPPLSGPMARWLAPTSESRVERIAIEAVHDRPWWPGSDVEPATLAALRASIASRGIIEPLLLRRRGKRQVRGGLRISPTSRRARSGSDPHPRDRPRAVRARGAARRGLDHRRAPAAHRGSHRPERTPAGRGVHCRGNPRPRRPAVARPLAGGGPGECAGIRASSRSALASAPFCADIAFDLPHAEVLPQMSPEALTAALAALDGVSLVALVR